MPQDASAAYEQVCDDFNFPGLASVGRDATFASAYADFGQGSDFAADFEGLLNAIAGIMGTNPPCYDGGDWLSTSILNWPDE